MSIQLSSDMIVVGRALLQGVGTVPQPITLDAATVAYAAAAATAGSALSARRQGRHSRMMARLRAASILAKLNALYLIGDSEAQWQINHVAPGTHNLTKNGTPTVEAGEGVSTSAIGNFYDTGIVLNSLSRDDVSMGVYIANGSQVSAPSSSSAGAYDCGAYDGTGGLAIHTYLSTDSKAHFRAFSTDAAAGTGSTAFWRGLGWNGFTRRAADKIRIAKNGVVLTEDASTAVTSTASTTITILKANGSSNRCVRKVAGFFVGAGLTDDQLAELSAATKDYLDCVKFGDPIIQEKGFGDVVIDKDLIVYGLGMGAISCAYEAARLGLSVALVGDWQDETIWALGGMPANGLGWIDATERTTITGIMRDLIIDARERVYTGYSGDPTAQTTLSIEARAYNLMCRRLLDPTRTDGTRLHGADITVYMTGGVKSVRKSAGVISSFRTRDGRTFKGKQFHDASYDGDLVYYAGCPVVSGMEVAGSGIEAYSGFDPTRLVRPSASGTALNVDPYVTAGNPASGLLPGVRVLPSTSAGSADPAHQSMNYRLTVSSGTSKQRAAQPVLSVAPVGYSAAAYEVLGRAYKAASDAAVTYALSDVITSNATYDFTFDLNNGGQISIDLLNSGVDYVAGGADIAARQAVIDAVYNWERGFIYWHRQGDTRIPSAVSTFFADLGLDAWSHLDPGSRGGLFWPARAYIRDATFMLKNAGFVLDANDVAMADGTTPRSVKTIAAISYRRDRHAQRLVNDAGVLKAQGALSDSTSGGTLACGTDVIAPWPFEASVPDSESCTNLSTSTAPSMTKLAWASARMEPAMAQVGQFLAHAHKAAIDGNVAIQNVDYPTVRTAALSAPYTRALLLPQVN